MSISILLLCIHVEEKVLWGKEIRACTKLDNYGICVIIPEEMWFKLV